MIARYAHTLRHLRPWQVAGRLVAPVQRRLAAWRLQDPPSRLQATGPTPTEGPDTEGPEHDPWNCRADVLEGHFCFLNERAQLGRPVDWTAPEQSLLWRFNLHYFDYLHLLETDEQEILCREWIAANPVGEGVGWHPYPISLRLVNWCRAGLTASGLLESLYQQAAYLSRTVETHVYGNHLLENARALVLAGGCLQGQGEADQWIEQGLSIYRDELEEQVLADGFHFERSPMYHALVLEGILDVLNVLPDGHAASVNLRNVAQRMAGALKGATHPDGQIALFNDATREIAPPPARLLQYARAVLGEETDAQTTFPEAGYYVLDAEDLWMMIDGGPAGPDYLMAHAHADIFSYELSLFGERFVVDSGVYEYAAGPMRRYVRGTAAHNTAQVDGLDQIECWDAFRVARRDAPRDVTWRETEAGAVFEGTYDGYQSRVGDDLSHRRRVEIDTHERCMHVQDEIVGRGRHCVESRIHLHPDVHVQEDGQAVSLARGENRCRVEVGAGTLRHEEGWYCPRFGIRHRVCVLVVEEEGQCPLRCSYQLQY
jgi:uncharacterized heparinase superfamily protein